MLGNGLDMERNGEGLAEMIMFVGLVWRVGLWIMDGLLEGVGWMGLEEVELNWDVVVEWLNMDRCVVVVVVDEGLLLKDLGIVEIVLDIVREVLMMVGGGRRFLLALTLIDEVDQSCNGREELRRVFLVLFLLCLCDVCGG